MTAPQPANPAAERTLLVLMEMNGAHRGAVFSGEQLRISASRGIVQADLDRTRIVWARFRSRLESAEPVVTEDQGFAVLPLLNEHHVVGAVCLSKLDPEGCSAAERARLLGVLTRAISKEEASGQVPPLWAGLLGQVPGKDFEREKLLYLLEHNEWNIARVARLVGVTRRTIYLRLERYGIERQHIRKDEAAT